MRKTKKKKKPNAPKPLCKKGMEVQTVLFDGKKWTRKEARAWLLEHKLKAPKAELEGKYLRYRQAPPTQFDKDSFRMKSIPRKGIKLIVACPKKKTVTRKKKVTKKPPRKINTKIRVPSVLVELGSAVEIALNGATMGFRGYALCANTEGTKLFLISKKGKKAARPTETATVKKARRLYATFTDYESEQSYNLQLKEGEFKLIGKADHIVYESDKWTGKKVEYIHEFKTPPSIYANANKTIVALVGKGIHVRKEGITG